MAWLVKQYPDGKYGLYSSISDGYIVRKCTREHMIQAIEKIWRRGWREQIKQLNDEFPEGWLDKDSHSHIRREQIKEE